jgi:hypothetical protein
MRLWRNGSAWDRTPSVPPRSSRPWTISTGQGISLAEIPAGSHDRRNPVIFRGRACFAARGAAGIVTHRRAETAGNRYTGISERILASGTATRARRSGIRHSRRR